MGKTKANNGGRPPGATNKVTRETKELILKFVQDNLPKVVEDWEKLPPRDRISTFMSILRYVIPPAKNTEAEEQTNDTLTNLINRLFPTSEK